MKKTVKILGKEYDIEKTINLDLSHEGLTEIPREINELVNLRTICMNDNKIKKIENLDRLINLERLYLYNNEIERIGGLDNNRKLISLWVEYNNIKVIENIHHLDNLRELYIFDEFVPEDIEEAKRVSLINERAKKLERI